MVSPTEHEGAHRHGGEQSAEATARKTFGVIIFIMRVMAAEMRNMAQGTMYGQAAILQSVYFQPVTQSALADEAEVSRATMSTTVSTMEARGWVRRERDRQDRRVVWVHITPEGKQFMDAMSATFEGRIAEALHTLPPETQHTLDHGLDSLQAVFAHVLRTVDDAPHFEGGFDLQQPRTGETEG